MGMKVDSGAGFSSRDADTFSEPSSTFLVLLLVLVSARYWINTFVGFGDWEQVRPEISCSKTWTIPAARVLAFSISSENQTKNKNYFKLNQPFLLFYDTREDPCGKRALAFLESSRKNRS